MPEPIVVLLERLARSTADAHRARSFPGTLRCSLTQIRLAWVKRAVPLETRINEERDGSPRQAGEEPRSGLAIRPRAVSRRPGFAPYRGHIITAARAMVPIRLGKVTDSPRNCHGARVQPALVLPSADAGLAARNACRPSPNRAARAVRRSPAKSRFPFSA
jgi:hypothetical protein